ncbi:leucine-rich repeat domain-containing protein, partial [Robinsoniella sp.]
EYQQGNTTASSWETYFTALENARIISANPAAMQADVDAAAAELLNAVKGLTKRAEILRVSEIKVLAELCRKMEGQYPQEIYAPVKLLLEELQELLEKEAADVGEMELEEAYAALEDAQHTLLEYQPVNTEVLMEAIKAAKSLDRSRYTKESYDKVWKAIIEAEQVDLTDQSAINEAVKNLLAGICGLKEIQEEEKTVYADLSQLHSAIKLASEVDRSKYTEASLHVLDNALTVARALADAKPVKELQATVDQAVKAVKESIQSLVVKPSLPVKNSSHKVGSLIYKVTKSTAGSRTVMLVKPSRRTLSSVKIPDTVELNGYTFQVTSIGKNAFKGNNRLKAASVGKYVESIGDGAFYKCTKLTSITIGSGLRTIGKKTFYGNKLLKTIKIKSSKLNKAGSQCLKGISTKAVIDVPNKKVKDYKKVFSGKGQSGNVKIK